jgi:hypothetical protein
VGIGSDQDAVLDLNPAKKQKQIQAEQKAAKDLEAAQKQEREQLQQAFSTGQITAEQYANALNTLNQKHREQNQLLQQNIRNSRNQLINEIAQETGTTTTTTGGLSASSNQTHNIGQAPQPASLFYAYLTSNDPSKPRYVLTFPSAAGADAWYREVAQKQGVQRLSHQFYTYGDVMPHPIQSNPAFASSYSAGQMIFSPIAGCHPVIPPQTADGYLVGPKYVHSYCMQSGPQTIGIAGNNYQTGSSTWTGNSSQQGGQWNGTNNQQGGQWNGTNNQQGGQWNGTNNQQGGQWNGTNNQQGGQWNGTNNQQGGQWNGTNNQQGGQWNGTNNQQGGQWNGTNNQQGGQLSGGNNTWTSSNNQSNRPKWTMESASWQMAQCLKNQNDLRPINVIQQEILNGLRSDCLNCTGTGVRQSSVS